MDNPQELKKAILAALAEKGDYGTILKHLSGEEKKEVETKDKERLTQLIEPLSELADLMTQNTKGVFMENFDKKLSKSTREALAALAEQVNGAIDTLEEELRKTISTTRDQITSESLQSLGDAKAQLEDSLMKMAVEVVSAKADALLPELKASGKLTEEEINNIVKQAALSVESQITRIIGEYLEEQDITVSQIADFQEEVQKLIPAVDFSNIRLQASQIDGLPEGGTSSVLVQRMIDNALANFSGAGSIVFQEEDGSPTGTFDTIKVTNGTLTDNGDGSASLNIPPPSGGEANTATNVGTAGVGVFKQKTAANLEFKNINAGSGAVTVTDDTGNDEVDIDLSAASKASLALADTASQPGHTHVAADVTNFDTEVANNTDVAANTAARHAAVTVTDSSEIDFTLTGQNITASLIAGSIDETKLDASTNASLNLADSAVQSVVAGTNVTVDNTDPQNPVVSATGGGAGVTDGDKGDITVSSSGSVWTIDNDAVTFDKIQNIATNRVLARSSAGTGSVEDLTLPQFRTLINVEDGADVTDTANVTAAGALMDSEVTNLAAVKAFNPADYATAAQGATADSALQSVVAGTNVTVDNTDPQNPIISATGGGGTGDVVGPASATDNAIVRYDSTTGKLVQDSNVLVDDTGKISRGTNNAWGLNLTGDSNAQTNIGQWTYTNSALGAAGISAYTARGTEASPSASLAGDWLLGNTGRGYGTTGFTTGSKGRFVIHAAENWTDTTTGTYITLWTTPIGSASVAERWRLNADGSVSMDGGTTNITAAEFGYLTGLTSSIQTQLNAKLEATDIASGTITPRTGAINFSGGTDGDVLTVQADGSLAPEAPAGGGGNTYFNNEYIDQSGGTSDTYGALAGAINGSNTTFTVSQGAYASGTLEVFQNGKLVLQGTGGGWTETTPASGTFSFVVAPETDDEITVRYQTQTLSTNTVITDATANVGGASWVVDEDNMVSDSATRVPTQQSVKAYVDANAGGGPLVKPSTDHTISGNNFTSAIVAATTISTVVQSVQVDTAGKWAVTNATTEAGGNSKTLGITVDTASADAAIEVFMGPCIIRDDSFSFTKGQTIYLDTTAGSWTATAPSTTGNVVRKVGICIDPGYVLFDPDNTYLTVA